MKLSPIYDTARPPVPEYADFALRVLLNPARAVLEDFDRGGFSPSEQERALLATLRTLIDDTATSAADRKTYRQRAGEIEADIAERTGRMGRALQSLYGTTVPFTLEIGDTHIPIDFTTPEHALATVENRDLPDELAYWLAQLPHGLTTHRREFMQANLPKSFGSGATASGAS